MAKNIDHAALLSEATRTRPPSSIRSLFPAELIPGMVSFLAGKPNASTFPLEEVSLTLKPDSVGGALADGKPVKISIAGADLVTALQYGPTAGIPKLVKWLTDFVSEQHGRPIIEKGSALDGKDGQSAWGLTVGNGSQDLLGKAFEAVLDPGDIALVEEPAYSGILPQIFMLKATAIPIGSDEEGLCPHKLREALEGWSTNPKTSSLKFPKLVYTTPTGANPAGTTASEQRKREVLQVVQEFNILLFEDDPYYYLSFVGLGEGAPETRRRTPSYWALEQENRAQRGTGRVLRFDSMSKIMSAGLRIGFATGPCVLIDAICVHTASSNLQPAGPTQAIALALLQHWGRDGFLQHADKVAEFYRNRRDQFEAAVTRILGANSKKGTGKQIANWVRPVAGMFLWLKLKLPPTDASPEGDSFALISEKARDNLVLALPGASFIPGNGKSCYVRMSFSMVPEDQIELGLTRLRKTLEEAWKEAGLEIP
ncbi:hypothetical protein CF327_g1808 [Tilletia walkeri]|uniref:Aminotransferase class I/classII large domain-containing protein n=1 Tax=Tilletia walkeri TaxID=117179 RepID=A0A8X7NGJ7_9BASI|nr:hypothetical protein CF327_g1808 [Tilletia walkeri]KAE8271985.1 hypothetical protein A4X09_0g349 [Tilletia walkeri]